MGIQGYLKIDDIQGESKRADHEDEIDFHGLYWKIKQKGSSSAGRRRSRGRADVSGVTIWKAMDAASPYLALAAMQGKSIPEAVAMVRKDSGDAHLDYLKITMTNCMISAVELLNHDDATDDANDQVIHEKITITCQKINVIYTVQADDHSAGDEHEIEYDIVKGA